MTEVVAADEAGIVTKASPRTVAETVTRLTEVLKAGGFSRVRRATATPFNLVLEARP